MSPEQVSKRIVVERLEWVEHMVHEIESLPLDDYDLFFSDNRNLWTAESCLRRALEALLDLGRHVLAKGFGIGTTEYKEIATRSQKVGILSQEDAALLRKLAGYRNRLVHFYHEVQPDELFAICADNLHDVTNVADAYRDWLNKNSDKLDHTL
jgi:uncharacterized protein YutE (UPF0331/DUF86 family)